jgi:rod shape-determining protein MreB
VVAVSIDDNKVVAVGNDAREMLGRTPTTIVASRPMRDGVIADYVITEAMLRYFIDKVCGTSRLFKPEVMICVPSGVTSVEKRAVLDATMAAGAKTAYLIDEPLAASIGAKIPIANPSGNMIIDIGGGSAEAAVISLGGVVVHGSVRVAGNKIDEAISTYIRRKYNLIIGERMSEEIKITVASAIVLDPPLKMEIKGRDAIDGLPKIIEISSNDITDAIGPSLQSIVSMARTVLEQTPPELAADIIDKGIVISGGTSQLRMIDRLVSQAIGVPAYVADESYLCVARGTGIALDNLESYKRSILSGK